MRFHSLAPIMLLAVAGCRSRTLTAAVTPVIVSVSPNSGPRTGGTVVDIKGSGFGREPFVTFGPANVTSFQSASDTEIVLVTPTSFSGPAAVTVVNAGGGQQTFLDAFYFMPVAPQGHDARFYPSALTSSGATLVMVTGSGQSISGLTLSVPASATGSISGLLTDAVGIPLIGHPVVATRADGTLPAVAMPAGVDGRYLISGLPAGSYYVQSREPAGSSFANQAWSNAFRLGSAQAVEVVAAQNAAGIDLALPVGGTITGTVLMAGGPGPAGVVSVDDSAGSLAEVGALCASGGGYALTGLAPGGYRLEATGPSNSVATWWPDAFGEESATVVAVSGSASVIADFNLRLGGSIGGVVIEEGTALPLPGVLLVASDASLTASISATTNSNGGYVLPSLPAGSYRLQAPELGQFYDAVTSSSGAMAVAVASGQSVGGINWVGRLDPEPVCGNPTGTGSVTGLVIGADSQPVLRASVLVTGTAGQGAATSGADGGWTVGCLPPGNYLVGIHAPGSNLLSRQIPVVVVAQASQQANSSLPAGATLSGKVVDQATALPLSGVPVVILNENTEEAAETVTATDGSWVIDRFPSGGLDLGSYRIEAKSSIQTD